MLVFQKGSSSSGIKAAVEGITFSFEDNEIINLLSLDDSRKIHASKTKMYLVDCQHIF